MLQIGHYVFKRAETSQEFEQVHRLNHRTFVEEIPQHAGTNNGLLVDKFHHKNFYLIVLREERVVGMISAHDQPPFSVADRLQDQEILERPGIRPLEVRLLAIEPQERNGTMFVGLVWSLYEYARTNGYTHLLISGVEERVDLYERLGFVALGPAVPCGKASFVPMILTIGQLPLRTERVKKLWETHLDRQRTRREAACLLPGPVTLSSAVQSAFHQPLIYHRGPEFIRRFQEVRHRLSALVGGREAVLLNGSGTLGNEVVAATLAAQQRQGAPGRGVMLVNGEFGERLARQATRFGLQPRRLSWPWGQPWNLEQIDACLASEPAGSWVWGVHQESSTGVCNDPVGLVAVAQKYGIRVCLDCISSLGAVPLRLDDVYLATGASGKSLGACAGAAIIFADGQALQHLDRSLVPSYLDIVAALNSPGPCYTFPSPTLLALEAALAEYATPALAQAAYARYHDLGVRVRQYLRRLGIEPLALESHAAPVVTTFTPPGEDSSVAFVGRCRSWGYAIGGESAYLAQRRLVQIATMGAVTHQTVTDLFDRLAKWLDRKSSQVTLDCY